MTYKIKPQKISRIEVLLSTASWRDIIARYRKFLTIGVAVVLVTAAVGGAGWFYLRYLDQKAAQMEFRASQHASSSEYDQALGLYRQIVEKYPRTRIAPVAAFQIGMVEAALGRKKEALESYRKILKYPARSDLRALARLKIGYLLRESGDDSGALQEFKSLLEDPQVPLRDAAGFEQGRVLEALNRIPEAIAVYEKVKDFPGSPWGSEALARLKVLRPAPEPPPQATLAPVTPPDSEKK